MLECAAFEQECRLLCKKERLANSYRKFLMLELVVRYPFSPFRPQNSFERNSIFDFLETENIGIEFFQNGSDVIHALVRGSFPKPLDVVRRYAQPPFNWWRFAITAFRVENEYRGGEGEYGQYNPWHIPLHAPNFTSAS
jgi:hypothetical protein